MAKNSNKSAIAAIAQSVAGTFVDPVANLMACSNLRLDFSPVTVANDEYTGTVDRPGDEIIGKTVTVSFDINLRGPGGGSTVPTSGAWLPGIFLIAAKMTELRTATSIPAAPEALSAGSTTGFTGGAGMTGAADLYKGMLVDMIGTGLTKPLSLSAIRTNTAGKAVTLCDTLASSATGNYQIVKQLGFYSTTSATDPLPLSMKVWLDGVRYDLIDMAMASLTITVETSPRDSGSNPKLNISLKGRINAKADEATPAIPSGSTTPKFRNGKMFLGGKALGGDGFSIDRGLTTVAPPNPNQPDGSDADQLTGIQTSGTVNIQSYSKAFFDELALADAQAQQAFYALWGSVTGNTVAVVVPDARLSYGAPQLSNNDIIKVGVPIVVDVFDRSVAIVFPYW